MTAFHTLLLNGIFLGLVFLILPFDTFLLFHFATVCIQISYAVAVFWQFRGQQVTVYAFVALAAAEFASCLVCYAFGQPLAMYGICLLQLCLDAAAYLILRKCVTDMPVSIARHFFIAFIIDGLIWVCVLLLRSLYASPSDLSCNFVLLAECATCNIALLFLPSYFYTKLKSASNTYFFSRIFKASSFSAPSISSEPLIENYFLLATFISPSSFIARIRDEITPYVGSFGIKSQIEYDVPANLSKSNAINVPIIFQGKCELTRELTFSSPQGYGLHRLSDDDLKSVIQKELVSYFRYHTYPTLVRLGPFVDFLFSYNRFQDDNQFKTQAMDAISQAFGLKNVDALDAFISTDQLHEDSVSFLKVLLNSYRFVKPIVIEVSSSQGFSNRLTVNVERHVPQVPLREYSSMRMVLLVARIKRFFTKKRMHYYFGLGMAATQRGAHPFAPLVLDDAGSLEAMAAAVMRLHSTLMTVGRCYTTDATGGRAALELGRVESVLAGAFCTIFGQSPADRFADIFDQVTYVAEHMVKDHIFEDGNKRTSLVFALSVLRFVGTPAVLSDSPEPKDNQYYAWIQDLVSSRRTNSKLVEELRCGCVAGTGDPSRV